MLVRGLVLVALALALGCGNSGANAPRDPASEEAAPEPRERLIEVMNVPAVLDEAGERAVREAFLAEVDVGSIPEPAAREELSVADVGLGGLNPESVEALQAVMAERAAVEAGEREADPGFANRIQTPLPTLRGEPWVKLRADGTAEVHYLAAGLGVGANVTFGAIVPSDPLGLARHRQRSTALQAVAAGHRFVVIDLKRVMFERYDVEGTLRTGRGTTPWRLEYIDPSASTSRVTDGRFNFRCDPCQESEAREGEGRAPSYTRLPGLRLGPFVDQVGPGGAMISFESDIPTAAGVVVFAEGREARTHFSEMLGLHHEIALGELEPGTRYRYQPVLVDHRGEVWVDRGGTFETEQDGLDTFSFVVMSDSRSGHGAADEQYGGTNGRVLHGLLLQAVQRDPRLVMFVGDLIDGYTTHPEVFQAELDAWKRVVQPFHASLPIYEVMGNHEALVDMWRGGPGGRALAAAQQGPESAESLFGAAFVNPGNGPEPEGPLPYAENTYSFEFGNAHFAVINTNYNYRSHPDVEDYPGASRNGQREGWVNDATIAWLEADLAAAREAGQRHLFVFTHEPGFPNGGHVKDGIYWHGDPAVLAQRQQLYDVMSRHRVAVIFHGDEHNYSRTHIDSTALEGIEHPVWQIISGGAGAPYYAQDRSVPWVDNVRAFDPRQHIVLVSIRGDEAEAEAISLTGEVMDRFDLYPAGQGGE